jgi:parallel beta-helix repeat protein
MSRFTIIFDALVRGGDAVIGKRRSWLGLAGLAAACMFVQPAMATIVGTCKAGVQFPTISQAVQAAPSGGTVSICPGTYPEQVQINKPLSLVGLTIGASDQVVITAPSGGIVQNATDLYTGGEPIAAQIYINGPSGSVIVNLTNLIVDGSNSQIDCGPNLVGIYYQNSSGTVNHVVARNQALGTNNGCQSGQGIFVESGYSTPGSSNVTIENSSVHGYQKNGITADGNGTTFTISNNDVVGQGPTTGAAENGIQLSDQATGTVYNNRVVDDVYSPGSYGASGILVYDTGSVIIQSNTVSNTQYGIVVYTDGTYDANDNTITSNRVSATHLDDGIDLCSDGNTVKSNIVMASDSSGIHIDSSCTDAEGNTTGTGNTVSGNTIVEACAGVLLGNGPAGQDGTNAAYDVFDTTYAGDSCPAGSGSAAKRATKLAVQRMR